MTTDRPPCLAADRGAGPAGFGPVRRFVGRATALDLRSLAVFRILVGTILVADALARLPGAPLTLTADGVLPPDLVRRFIGHPWSWSIGLWCDAAWWGYGLLWAEGVCGVLLAAGIGLPWTTTAAWVVVVSLVRRTAPVTNAGDVFLAVLLFWGQFLPLGSIWAWGAGSRGGWRSREPLPHHGVAAFALTLQVAAVYLSAGMGKWNDVWWSGEAVGYALSVHDHGTTLGNLVAGWRWGARWLTWATPVVEFAGPLLLLVPRLRLPLVGVFVLFHLAIAVTMDVCLFPWVGIAAWVALLPGSLWDRIGAGTIVFTDGSDGEARLDPARRILCLAALGIAAVAFAHANGPWQSWRMPAGLRHAVQLTFLEQDWRVFAEIRPQRQWVYGRADLANGATVDILRRGRPLETVLPAGGFHSLGDQRLQKLLWELPKPDHRAFAPSLATGLVKAWNASHPPGEQIVALEIHGARMVMAPRADTIQDVLMATWPPRSPTGRGNLERFLRDDGASSDGAGADAAPTTPAPLR